MRRVPPKLTANARDLRNGATKAERLLWRLLSNYRPRFTRQLVIGSYIVDLACREAKLAVELDGSQHIDRAEYDQRRTEFLESQGWSVLAEEELIAAEQASDAQVAKIHRALAARYHQLGHDAAELPRQLISEPRPAASPPA